MSEDARFWIGMAVTVLIQLLGLGGAIAIFFRRAGNGEGKIEAKLEYLGIKLDGTNTEIGKVAAASTETAKAIWHRVETLEGRQITHGERLAEHTTRIKHLESKT